MSAQVKPDARCCQTAGKITIELSKLVQFHLGYGSLAGAKAGWINSRFSGLTDRQETPQAFLPRIVENPFIGAQSGKRGSSFTKHQFSILRR